jgi:hypothetical protein
MNAILILLAIAALAAAVAYLSIKSSMAKSKIIAALESENKELSDHLRHAKEIYTRSLEARRELEKDLATLRTGTATDKLDASLDILQDIAGKTATNKPAPGLADLGRTAGRNKPNG